jgi:hypothetical protein
MQDEMKSENYIIPNYTVTLISQKCIIYDYIVMFHV